MLPIGGPGKALSAKEQADILFRLTGLPPKYFPVPVALMDGIIGLLDLLSKAFPQLKVSCTSPRFLPPGGALSRFV
jgi:divinyl chlorophyllide a 8-vinyl-reductase